MQAKSYPQLYTEIIQHNEIKQIPHALFLQLHRDARARYGSLQ